MFKWVRPQIKAIQTLKDIIIITSALMPLDYLEGAGLIKYAVNASKDGQGGELA